MRIEVGYGLEGTLTDAVTQLIIENAILPRFRADDFPGGIERGVDDIIQVLTGDAEELKQRAAKRAGRRRPTGRSILLIIFVHRRSSSSSSACIAGSAASRAQAGRAAAAAALDRHLPMPGSWLVVRSSGSGGGSSGGGFSGGGGSFGGGGSSGSW